MDYKLPDNYLMLMKEMFESQYDDFLKIYDDKALKGLSINSKKISKDEFKKIINIKEDVLWSKQGLYIDDDMALSKNPLYHTGAYYIQEPSAMAAVNFMDIQKGMRVLDMCASPGGKTIQISQLLSDDDLLVSNDINAKRIPALLRNIEYYGAKNVIVVNENQENMSKAFPEFFDRILLDAPCSGEGMFRKDKKLISSYDKSKKELPYVQADLIEKASSMLKSGGKMMYSTCTFNKDENEYIILDFLRKHKEFELINIDKNYGMTSFEELKSSARFFPHKTKSEGHFLCLLRKKYSTNNVLDYKNKPYIKKKDLPKEYLDFEKRFLNISLNGNFYIQNNSLYLEIFDKLLPKKFRIVRNGLYLGDIKNKEFRISSAFIRHLKSKDFKNILNFDIDDLNLIKYLKGDTIIIDDKEDKDYIICLNNLPIGLSRLKNSKLKNLYNKNWRLI